MKLANFVATDTEAPQFFRKPFHLVGTDGTWCCACDEKALIAVKAQLKLPKFRGPAKDHDTFVHWLEVKVPDDAEEMQVAELLDWTGPADGQERPGVVLGAQVDRCRLAKLLGPLKGVVTVWNSQKEVAIPGLLLAKGGVWRAVLAGYSEVDEDTPHFGTQSELFDLAMDLD